MPSEFIIKCAATESNKMLVMLCGFLEGIKFIGLILQRWQCQIAYWDRLNLMGQQRATCVHLISPHKGYSFLVLFLHQLRYVFDLLNSNQSFLFCTLNISESVNWYWIARNVLSVVLYWRLKGKGSHIVMLYKMNVKQHPIKEFLTSEISKKGFKMLTIKTENCIKMA